jgi:hypothetical protein
MRPATWRAAILAVACMFAQAHAGDKVDYLTQIKPILERRCYACHGAIKQRGGVRLDTVALMTRPRADPVVVPGDAKASFLHRAILGEGGVELMPREGQPLTDDQVALIKAWIEQGATGPADEPPMKDPREHWSFVAPVKPAPPRLNDPMWAANPVDAWIAAGWQSAGVAPTPPADRRTLIRRVHLDLIGLPPSPQQVEAFVADESPDAWEKLVDRLLASPQYGERWGRHWMDVWRYTDWMGYRNELRESARHIWRWRDWIVRSLNADMPYDRMIVHMLAGDEAAPTDESALTATGFLARNYFRYNRNVWMENTLEHTAKAMLGLTINCARCHDHMYDPITQEDYYRFRAFFEPHQLRTDRLPHQPNVELDGLPRIYDAAPAPTHLFIRGEEDRPDTSRSFDPAIPSIFGATGAIQPVKLPLEAWHPSIRDFEQKRILQAARDEAQKKQAALDALKARSPAAGAQELSLASKHVKARQAQLQSLEARIAADRARYADPPAADSKERIAQAAQLTRQATLLTTQADYLTAKQEEAEAQAQDPSGFKAATKAAVSKHKLALKNYNLAKNAMKQDPVDYEPIGPTYPSQSSGRRLALATWIASKDNPLAARVAVNHIWMRHFHTPLVASVFDFGLAGKSPSHPQLLDDLAVRLMESGWSMKSLHRLIVTSRVYRLASTLGPADHPARTIDPDNKLYWHFNARRAEAEAVRDSLLAVSGLLDLTPGGPDLDAATAMTTHRRSIYYRHAPEKFSPFMLAFDSASVTECYRRVETVVPQQALAMANSPLAIAAARQLASSIQAPDQAAYIDALFRLVLGRPPAAEESAAAARFLEDQARRLSDPSKLTAFDAAPKKPTADSPAADPRRRARENLAHVMLNHNEFLMIR